MRPLDIVLTQKNLSNGYQTGTWIQQRERQNIAWKIVIPNIKEGVSCCKRPKPKEIEAQLKEYFWVSCATGGPRGVECGLPITNVDLELGINYLPTYTSSCCNSETPATLRATT